MAVVELDITGGIATVELRRPDRHNAFNREMGAALHGALDRIDDDASVRCVVVRGAGRSLCSGADLSMVEAMTAAVARQFMLDAAWAFRRLERLPVPVVAAAKGYCLGGGFELLLHTDVVVCAASAKLGLPEANIGLVTTAGSVARLIRAIGSMRAKELLLSGRKVSGEEAAALGLAARCAADDDHDAAVEDTAARMAEVPRQGARAVKDLFRDVEREATTSWIAEVETFERLVADIRRRAASDEGANE